MGKQRPTIGFSAGLLATAIVMLCLLAGAIAISPRILLYDERYYMESAYFLRAYRDIALMMATPLDLAAGPFYALFHVALAPVTGLHPPAIRFANLAALVLAIGATAAALRKLELERPVARGAMLLAVPMIWPTSGLALTEIPALACAALACAAVTGAMRSSSRAWLLWIGGGLAAGCAVLARQTYLPAFVAFPVIAWALPRHRSGAAIGLLVAVLAVLPMVVAWGGLTFPQWEPQRRVLAPEYGVLAFVYLATAMTLIAPHFFFGALRTRRIWGVILAVTASLGALAAATGARFPIAARVIAALPEAIREPAAWIAFSLMATLAVAACAAAVLRLWENRSDRRFLLLALLTTLLTGTAAGIGHQFSSRYVLTAFPFALLLVQPWFVANRWAALRLGIGAALGFASLAAYYWNRPPGNAQIVLSAPPEIVAAMPLERPPQ